MYLFYKYLIIIPLYFMIIRKFEYTIVRPAKNDVSAHFSLTVPHRNFKRRTSSYAKIRHL